MAGRTNGAAWLVALGAGVASLGCNSEEAPDGDTGDSDIDADADLDSDSDTATGTSGTDCWEGVEIRTVPELCELPCDPDGQNCALLEMRCVRIDGCGEGSNAVCATSEEFCAAYACPQPCCSSTNGVPELFWMCGSECCN